MDKNIIKQYLNKTFIQEVVDNNPKETVDANIGAPVPSNFPAKKLSSEISKKNKKSNSEGVDDIAKEMKSYEKGFKKQDPNKDEMAINKFNYNTKKEEEYHDQMEIMNGMEMVQYDREPDSNFTERAMEAIAGSARMGNSNEWANVVEEPWGGNPKFGENLVKKIKKSIELRNKETPTIHLQGKDIEADRKDYGNKPYAFENTNKKNNQIKETMKRLRFKSEFNGVGNALKLIPESYKVDNKIFEMTDGNENYRIRWEGSSEDGSAVVLMAADKKLVNEDIQRMKALFNYKSETTLGTVKGKDRINENAKFDEIWKKTKAIMEADNIDDHPAKEGDLDDAVDYAKEAGEHIEGNASDGKEFHAPKPKEGHREDNVKGQAKEAKKHIEGSVANGKEFHAPKPKEGHWGDNVKKQASEAKSLVKQSGKQEISAPKPKTGNPDDAVKHAPEAKKDVKEAVKKKQ
jgi:hypothetical protein